MGPTRAQPGAGAMQSPVRPWACSHSIVSSLNSAQRANANLRSLAVTMRKTTQTKVTNSTLTSWLVLEFSGMVGD